MFILSMTLAMLQLLTGTYSAINAFIILYGYLAIVFLMALPQEARSCFPS